ncbi:MAG: hypothetical protein R3330_18925, partial [Saprospiraceae bacterium]|nr:hypothetical protein [Saprospiraceae bacterium]
LNSQNDEYNTDFMYFLSLNVDGQDSNFMTYRAEDPVSSCTLADDPAFVEFDLLGGAANGTVLEQNIELLLAVEFPDHLPDPVISARDVLDHSLPWVQAGNEISFMPDGTCTSGMCQVDIVYPPRPGQRWAQYRSSPEVMITPEENEFATHLVLEFENLTCGDIDPLDLRLWVSDNSQTVYANQVDGDYLDLTLYLLPEPPDPEVEFHPVPALNRVSLAALALLLLSLGLWQARRH